MAHPVKNDQFTFEISLSVLNHLGRNLYRNFVTVLGEAISNSWDADASNVWINVDKENARFFVRDDGVGMTAEDFQGKFLKIGYSKRKERGKVSKLTGRPFIGAKGIGKLALLSCARRVTVLTKTKDTDFVGGLIDNTGLDKAITEDLQPQEYELEVADLDSFDGEIQEHDQGTIIIFEETTELLRHSIAYLRKMLALHFKFSLLDKDFTIHVNGKPVTIDDLKDLADSTQLLWIVNGYNDKYLDALGNLRFDPLVKTTALDIRGFVATVEKPRNLKISGTEERASIDLFVNGRLREKNIARHIPTQRIVENYLYGQIHFDVMDAEGKDPFTSSREGVVEDNVQFLNLLDYLKKDLLPAIIDEWDELRLKIGAEGDDENSRMSKKARRARDLYTATRTEYSPEPGSIEKDIVDGWLDELRPDAEFNFQSYADCFLSENLLRKYVEHRKISLDDASNKLAKDAKDEAQKWKSKEEKNLKEANISYVITKSNSDLKYLGMDELGPLSEGARHDGNGNLMPLPQNVVTYRPLRNAVGHTNLLTKLAQTQLNLTFENIKARVKILLKGVGA